MILGLCASGGWESSQGAAPRSCNEAIAHFGDSSAASMAAAISMKGEGRGRPHASYDLAGVSWFHFFNLSLPWKMLEILPLYLSEVRQFILRGALFIEIPH